MSHGIKQGSVHWYPGSLYWMKWKRGPIQRGCVRLSRRRWDFTNTRCSVDGRLMHLKRGIKLRVCLRYSGVNDALLDRSFKQVQRYFNQLKMMQIFVGPIIFHPCLCSRTVVWNLTIWMTQSSGVRRENTIWS